MRAPSPAADPAWRRVAPRHLAPRRLGRAGAVSVRGGDLALVARRSAGDASATPVGSRTVSAELQGELAARPDAGSFVARTALDGVEWDASIDAWHAAHPGRRMIAR